MVPHNNERLAAGGRTNQENTNYVGVPCKSSHCTLFSKEARPIFLLDASSEHFDCDHTIKRRLRASVYNSEPTAPDFFSIGESDVFQLSRHRRIRHIVLCLKRITISHLVPAFQLIESSTTQCHSNLASHPSRVSPSISR
jgi:hypothetical protein